MGIKIKVCCIQSSTEAELAIEAGATAVGLVSAMPSGPGVIDEKTIAEIAAVVPPEIEIFLLTSLTSAGDIIDQHNRCRTTTIQICDDLASGTHAEIKQNLPGVKIVQVLHVSDSSTAVVAQRIAPHVDGLLLDSGNPELAVKQLGGTGRTHNWAISREICASVDVPVYLAGGLNPANVGEAIKTVRPAGVDVCSGVRTGDKLDQAKVTAFTAAIKQLERGTR